MEGGIIITHFNSTAEEEFDRLMARRRRSCSQLKGDMPICEERGGGRGVYMEQ